MENRGLRNCRKEQVGKDQGSCNGTKSTALEDGSQELTASCCKPQHLWGALSDPCHLQHRARRQQDLPLEKNGLFQSTFQKSHPRDFLCQTLTQNYKARRILGNAFWLLLCDAEETGEEGDGDTEVTTDGPAPKSYFSYAPYPNFQHFMFLLYVHI